MPSQFRRSKTAFTLTELLVIIATISTLSAILFPGFALAREMLLPEQYETNWCWD
jgi:Tfp pilus assembly protein FimT